MRAGKRLRRFISWDGIIHTQHTTPEPELLTKRQKLTSFTPGRTTRKNMRLSALAWSGLHIMPQYKQPYWTPERLRHSPPLHWRTQTTGIISTLELRRWRKAWGLVKIIARLRFSLFSPLLIQNMPITGVRDAERTLKQRKIRTHWKIYLSAQWSALLSTPGKASNYWNTPRRISSNALSGSANHPAVICQQPGSRQIMK